MPVDGTNSPDAGGKRNPIRKRHRLPNYSCINGTSNSISRFLLFILVSSEEKTYVFSSHRTVVIKKYIYYIFSYNIDRIKINIYIL